MEIQNVLNNFFIFAHHNIITEKCNLKVRKEWYAIWKEIKKYTVMLRLVSIMITIKISTLTAIQITPTQNCKSKKADESMCSSYENEKQ